MATAGMDELKKLVTFLLFVLYCYKREKNEFDFLIKQCLIWKPFTVDNALVLQYCLFRLSYSFFFFLYVLSAELRICYISCSMEYSSIAITLRSTLTWSVVVLVKVLSIGQIDLFKN